MEQSTRAGGEPGEPTSDHERTLDDPPGDVLVELDDEVVEADREGSADGDATLGDDAASSPGDGDDGALWAVDDPEHSWADLQKWVSWAIVAACAVFVFVTLNPGMVLQNTTATGGDMGAHVWGPRFLADHLLPEFRVSGWTQDWYAGFPAYVFYMVVPSLLVLWVSAFGSIWSASVPVMLGGLLLLAATFAAMTYGLVTARRRLRPDHWALPLIWTSYVALAVLLMPVPYNIAFKLVTVSGLVTLPIAAYALARSARVAFPGPALVAVATLPFIYDKGFTILGGNGASTMAGEFAFSISLSLSLLYLAVMFKATRTRRDHALGAVLLALTILCHLIPAIFAGIATFILIFVRREDRTPWWDANTIGRVVAAVLVGLTLLTLVSDTDVFGLRTLRDLPGASVWFPSQWWFPALATAVAVVLFTGAQPRLLPWTRGRFEFDRSAAPVSPRLQDVRDLVQRAVQVTGPFLALGVAGVAVVAVVVRGFDGWTVALATLWLVLWLVAGVDSRLVRWLCWIVPVGGLLTGFWALPFLGNSTYMNDMGWEKYTKYYDYLLAVDSLDSGGMPYRNIVFALAGLGVLLALIHRVRFGWFLAMVVVVLAWTFRYFPQYRLWNARLLPFYYLALYLLAGLAIALVIRSIAIAIQDLARWREEPALVGAIGAVLATLFVGMAMLGGMKWLPNGTEVADPNRPGANVYAWGPFDFQRIIVNDWATWNYAGLEGKPAYAEFSGVMSMMESVGEEHGCGRAFWEYESDLNRYGTTMALMLLPYFTDGCIGSMEGLYFEASSTTPFHFLTQSELSTAPSRAQREMPYESFNITKGVDHLQLMGVKYYMATSAQAVDAARTDDRLTLVAEQTFTWPDANGVPQSHNWAVFEVEGSELVEPLANDPVVLSDADDHIDGWVYAKDRLPPTEAQVAAGVQGSKAPGPATLWFTDPNQWDVFLATSGPDSWPRATAAEAQGQRSENPPVEVTNIETTSDSISFDVDEVGVPVLVKVSYFPNWTVDGAEGPYRVTPNFMAVVPTEEHVTLSYGSRGVDWLGWLGTLLGLIGLAGLVLLDDRRRNRIPVATAHASDDADDASATIQPYGPFEPFDELSSAPSSSSSSDAEDGDTPEPADPSTDPDSFTPPR
jgi:uncharacterized membrane protein